MIFIFIKYSSLHFERTYLLDDDDDESNTKVNKFIILCTACNLLNFASLIMSNRLEPNDKNKKRNFSLWSFVKQTRI